MSKTTYVGLDVHLNSIMAVWGASKEASQKLEVPNREDGLAMLLKRIGSTDVWAVYEASSCGFEVYDQMTRRGWKVSVVAPTHVTKSVHARKSKTDLRDATHLRDLLMAHGELGTELPSVWIPPAKTREDREIVRRRLNLGENLSRIKTKILSLLQMHGFRRPEELKTLWTRKHVRWLQGLTETASVSESVRIALGSMLRELEFHEGEQKKLQGEVEALATREEYRGAAERMTEISGVGTLTAMTFLLELGDVNRFRNRRQVASYLGLVPSSFESGKANNRKGHITRMGPPRVRKVLNQAAWAFLRENPKWKLWYAGVAKRRGAKRAIVGLMRRLGIEMWHRARCA